MFGGHRGVPKVFFPEGMVKNRLPPDIKQKILGFRDCKMGAHRVNLVLRDGRVLQAVIVAWGDEIVDVGEGQVFDFDPEHRAVGFRASTLG